MRIIIRLFSAALLFLSEDIGLYGHAELRVLQVVGGGDCGVSGGEVRGLEGEGVFEGVVELVEGV